MTEHELQQMQDYEDQCAEEETDYEIAKRLYKKWQQTVVCTIDLKEGLLFQDWIEKQESEARMQRIADYLGG